MLAINTTFVARCNSETLLSWVREGNVKTDERKSVRRPSKLTAAIDLSAPIRVILLSSTLHSNTLLHAPFIISSVIRKNGLIACVARQNSSYEGVIWL